VLQAIRDHVEEAVAHAESGYSSAQEEEDTITGELGGALRTQRERVVSVTEGQPLGLWRWSITYSKFGSKAKNATESLVGADGILEMRVGNVESDQQKAALFQAKNTQRRDSMLVAQCAKMSVWREAAFVISYSDKGYYAYPIDDIILSGGSIARATGRTPLATWITDEFISCKVGHPDLYYDKNQRKLYWEKKGDAAKGYSADRWVQVDFSPKHLVHIDVTPPNWRSSRAVEIAPEEIPLSRLTFTANDLFGLKVPYNLAQLRKRKNELLHVYHSDKSHGLSKDIGPLLDARVIEINQAFSELSESLTTEKAPSTSRKADEEESSTSLKDSEAITFDEFFGERKVAEKVKIRHTKRNPRRG
jgi:hypothetical protein